MRDGIDALGARVSEAPRGRFLDEFPLLPSGVVEPLRQPLENGEISIVHGEEEATFPAAEMLVLPSTWVRAAG